jgi:hypothetical protein
VGATDVDPELDPPPPVATVGATELRFTGATELRVVSGPRPAAAIRGFVADPVARVSSTARRLAELADTKADSRLAARVAVGADAAATFEVTGPFETCGQPSKATVALAIKNKIAAPASSDPELPNPARYGPLARTVIWHRSGFCNVLRSS